MLRFYFSKGSSAVAAHILLEEVGAEYQAVEVSIQDGAHRRPEFLTINPKARIPALDTQDGVLTENPAILEYIAAAHPASECLPAGIFAQAKARELCAYLASTAHVAFAHLRRGGRWADSDAALTDMRARVPGNLADCAAHLETNLALGPWALGQGFTYCDPYLFQFVRWLKGAGVAVQDYPRLSTHLGAMLERESVRRVLDVHSG